MNMLRVVSMGQAHELLFYPICMQVNFTFEKGVVIQVYFNKCNTLAPRERFSSIRMVMYGSQ